MQSFLQEVAADLYRRYGEDVSSLHILFPTRRARHFFIDALSHLAERPMWQPRWLTIDDLMQEVSGLHSGERIRLIAELYKVYSACHDEPFDKFYFCCSTTSTRSTSTVSTPMRCSAISTS